MAAGASAGLPQRLPSLGVERHAAGAAVQDQLVTQDQRRTREPAKSRRPDVIFLDDVSRPDHLPVARIQGEHVALATERVDDTARDGWRRKRPVIVLDADLLV